MAKHELNLLIEVINPRDVPGYYLTSLDDARAVIAAVGEPNLKLQFNITIYLKGAAAAWGTPP